MTLRILRDAAVSSLRRGVPENLDRYREGDFSFLDLDPGLCLEMQVDPSPEALDGLVLPNGGNDYEVENCLAVYRFLSGLTPYDGRDERLWCYLTHTLFLEYTRARWPIPSKDDDAVAHIKTHFFAKSHRQVERDNAVSRLWWMAHLCTRVSGLDQESALRAFLFRTDVRANIIERPTVAQSPALFSVIVKALAESRIGQKALFERSTFRRVMVELNSIGGFRLLDALPESELAKLFTEVLTDRAGLAAL